MKGCSFRHIVTVIMTFLMGIMLVPHTSTSSESTEKTTVTLTVKTYDGLELPAQVVFPDETPKKLVLFINGSTPSDEKGNLGGSWDENGKLLTEPHLFYQRIIDTFPEMGYAVATYAKRSFVRHLDVPRPTLDELALDIRFYIESLKSRGILKSEDDLVVVGYSEGSSVATKLMGILKKQPSLYILLGSADSAYDYVNQPWEDWYMVEVLRKRGTPDDQIQGYFNFFKKLSTEIVNIDEETFEKEWKEKDVLGVGIAPWESYHIDKEVSFYDPLSNIICAGTPTLICIGEYDTAMPALKGERLYNRLLDRGYTKAKFKLIPNEVHAYSKHDVFLIMDTWIESGCATADFDPALAEQAVPIHEYTVPRTSGAITLDGRLDEESWHNAPFTENFVVHAEGDKPELPTKARMLWDDENLYVAFTVTDDEIWSTYKNHDDHLWKEEAVEVFIDPDGDSNDYLEIQINPLGTTLDIFMNREYTRGGKADFEWTLNGLDTGITVEGTINEEAVDTMWICEVAIPFGEIAFSAPSMNFPPKPGDTWRLNLCRSETDRSEVRRTEATSWNQTDYRGFHAPDRFGKIIFSE